MSFLSSLSTLFTHKVMGKQIIDNLKPVDQKLNQDRALKEKELSVKERTEQLKAKVARENMKNDLQISRIQAKSKPKTK